MAIQKTVELRKRILESMDQIPRTVKDIQEVLNSGNLNISTSQIGTNLKFLEKEGYVERSVKDHKNVWWKVEGKEYNVTPTTTMLVYLPVKLNDELARMAKNSKTTKTEVVRDALEAYLGL